MEETRKRPLQLSPWLRDQKVWKANELQVKLAGESSLEMTLATSAKTLASSCDCDLADPINSDNKWEKSGRESPS